VSKKRVVLAAFGAVVLLVVCAVLASQLIDNGHKLRQVQYVPLPGVAYKYSTFHKEEPIRLSYSDRTIILSVRRKDFLPLPASRIWSKEQVMKPGWTYFTVVWNHQDKSFQRFDIEVEPLEQDP